MQTHLAADLHGRLQQHDLPVRVRRERHEGADSQVGLVKLYRVVRKYRRSDPPNCPVVVCYFFICPPVIVYHMAIEFEPNSVYSKIAGTISKDPLILNY